MRRQRERRVEVRVKVERQTEWEAYFFGDILRLASGRKSQEPVKVTACWGKEINEQPAVRKGNQVIYIYIYPREKKRAMRRFVFSPPPSFPPVQFDTPSPTSSQPQPQHYKAENASPYPRTKPPKSSREVLTTIELICSTTRTGRT